MGSVFNGTYVDQRTRQECADAADHNGQAAFDFTVDDAGQDVAVFHGFFQSDPIGCAFGFFAGQFGFAEAVFDGFDGNGNEVADFNFNFALSVFEFSYIDQDSDFRPAFTVTKFWSIATTSAVITSPGFISCRVKLSSNS